MRGYAFLGLMAIFVCKAACAVAAAEIPSSPAKYTHKRLFAKYKSGHSPASPPEVTSRVITRSVVSAKQKGSSTSSSIRITSDMPPGTLLSGEYIVMFAPDVADFQAAVTDVHAHAVAAATVSTGDASTAAESVAVVSSNQAPEGLPSHAVIQMPPQMDPATVKAALRAPGNVEAVIANRVVRTAQATTAASTCHPAHFAAGVKVSAAANVEFTWEGCLTASTKLAMFGERCGPQLQNFRWTGIYAYTESTGQLVKNCVKLLSTETNAKRAEQLFGSCGIAPKHFSSLPTTVCLEDTETACANVEDLANYQVHLSRAVCKSGLPVATFQGVPCGPDNSLIQWNSLAAQGCSMLDRATADIKQQADWIGQCGVPPQQIVGQPTRICGRTPGSLDQATSPPTSPNQPTTPPSDGDDSDVITPEPDTPQNPETPVLGKLPWTSLKTGENANWGVSRVGAYDKSADTVADVADAAKASGYKVVVIDTGVDASHPDLNVVEFVDFIDTPGKQYYKKDGNGHGTHCAGIISAKNNGGGMFGVVPGLPVIAMKVLGKDGSGSIDGVYSAYIEVLARLKKGEKIVSINLSLSSQTDDQEAKKYECSLVSKITAFGTAVVAAAGNDGEALYYNLPAACQEAMTVTSLDVNDNPSWFSNYASTGNEKIKSLIAAPGHSIYSTYKDGAYSTLSGTSMATPFTAGAFAYCFLSGKCSLGVPAEANYQVMLDAAAAGTCSSSSKCGPMWNTAQYYGNMVNVRLF